MGIHMMLVTGSSGLIGNSLVRVLRQNRISTIALQRKGAGLLWDPYAASPISQTEVLEGVSAAVHLSGANVAQRWTPAYKREILNSRVVPTGVLATLLAGLRSRPSVLV